MTTRQARNDGDRPRPSEPTPLAAPAAYRAGLMLDLMARRVAPVTITVAAGALGLPKSSALNILVGLEAVGLVRRSPRGWLLGYKVMELSRAALTSTDVTAEFHRTVASQRGLVGETVLLAVLDGLDVIYVSRHDGHQPVRYLNEIGTRAPAAVTALGRAMLATLSHAELDRRLDGLTELPVRTARSLATPAELRSDLDAVRDRGYAIDAEQGVPGIACFSVAVGAAGPPTAVSVSSVVSRLTPEFETQVVADLTRLAARLRRLEQP